MKLDVEQYMLCMALYSGTKEEMTKYFSAFGPISRTRIEPLLDRKLIRSVSTSSLAFDNLRLDEKSFLELQKIESVSKWYDQWFELWPVGVKTGGYYVRTDQQGCKTKLSKFVKKYPQYTKDVIMEATQRYLFQRSLHGYEYTKLAPNFIEQHGVSVLAGECENVLNNTVTERPNIIQGDLFGGNEL